MKGHWLVAAALAAAAVAYAVKTHGSDGNSQLFAPARYSLVAAEVDAAMLCGENGSNDCRKAVFKLDSATGEVWVLQLSVMGGDYAQVTSASWYPVRRKAAATPGTNDF